MFIAAPRLDTFRWAISQKRACSLSHIDPSCMPTGVAVTLKRSTLLPSTPWSLIFNYLLGFCPCMCIALLHMYACKRFPLKRTRRAPVRRRTVGIRRSRFTKPRSATTVYYPMLPSRGGMSKAGVPDTMSLQLKTFDNKDVSGAVTHVEYAFKFNSCFDPMGDMSAIQPASRDQLATLYNSYIVLSGAYKFTFVNAGAAPVYVCAYVSGQAAVAQGVNNYGTQPGACYRLANEKDAGGSTVICKHSFKSQQVFGPLDRSSHGAAVGADPSTLGYVYVTIQAATGNVSGYLYVECIQNTVFFDKTATVHA